MLRSSGTFVKAADPEALEAALRRSGVETTRNDGGVRVDADSGSIGRIAASAGVALVELRPADGAGLEEMFLTLTAGTQREATTV